MGLNVGVNEACNMRVVIPGNNSPSGKCGSLVGGMNGCNARDGNEWKCLHVCRTDARQMLNGVVLCVLLLLEECFAVFRVKGGPGI